MSLDDTDLLPRILDLSRQMLRRSEAGEWEEAGNLEQQRRGLIQDCFPLTEEVAADPSTATVLEQIIDIDSKIMELGTKARQDVGAVLGKLQKGRQATNAYRKVGR